MSDKAPQLDKHQLFAADIAYLDGDGAPAQRVKAAIRAYLWAEGRESFSVNEVLEAIAE
jgi:hypothetical protein